jgi:hypothetical protein
LGESDNLDFSTSGSIKVSNKAVSEIDLSTAGISTSKYSEEAPNLIDGNTATMWQYRAEDVNLPGYVMVNLPSLQRINKMEYYMCSATSPRVYFDTVPITCTTGINTGGSCTGALTGVLGNVFDGWWRGVEFATVQTSTFALIWPDDFCAAEIKAYSPGKGTHKALVYGGENFWEWEAVTDTKDTPANTAVSYRYRTSTNGTSWTAWTSDFGSVTSRDGETKYPYLQIEATLESLDGIATPRIDEYDIDYHTEVKPSAPSAQTAVVQ